MAQQVRIFLVDDIDGGDASETVRFGLDGASYELDLSAENAQSFRETLAPYIEVARRAGGRVSRGLRQQTPARNQEIAQIRHWAKENGYTISDRGRVPFDIVEAYRKARG